MSERIYDKTGAVVRRTEYNDAASTVTTYDSAGTVTSTRAYTAAETATATANVAQDARLDDLTARMARVEAQLWPAPPAPTTTAGVPTWASLGGVWPAGGLLLDAGTVYRNVSGVPLTTAPSGFPGTPSAWAHLFVVALAAVVPPPTGTAWDGAGHAYKVGDIVTYKGSTYKCVQAHTSQPSWDPVTVASLWTKTA